MDPHKGCHDGSMGDSASEDPSRTSQGVSRASAAGVVEMGDPTGERCPPLETFVPDKTWPLRTFLMEGYRLQKVGNTLCLLMPVTQ